MKTIADSAVDPFEASLATGASGLLATFNRAGVLSPADVHVARMLGRITGAEDDAVLLAAALAVRAPRLGHVRVDLSSIRETATRDVDEGGDLRLLPWPDPAEWRGAVAASGVAGEGCPLVLEGSALYLDRYWFLERQVAADLLARAQAPPPTVDLRLLGQGLDRLFPPDEAVDDGTGGADMAEGEGVPGSGAGVDWQRAAAAAAVQRRLSIVAGGPGTGKTTTIARVIALLHEQSVAAGAPPPLVALAAPTGKAAARLAEAVHEEASRLPVKEPTRSFMAGLRGTTIHRLLRSQPQNKTRFRHNRANRLIEDAVIVDETSMVPLALMARLIEAVRPEARLVLAGDPEQLASVEAGAVLGDIVGPARGEAGGSGAEPRPAGAIADAIVVLRRTHRFSGILSTLATSIQRGDADAVIALLRQGDEALQWLDVESPTAAAADPRLRRAAVRAGVAVVEAARAGTAREALQRMSEFRILCGHRHGTAGAMVWGEQVERWLAAAVPGLFARGAWYAGRPLLVTANDYSLGLFNGDTGVVVTTPEGRPTAAFERAGGLEEVSPTRLGSVESAHAMTIHKSQGSQFRAVTVVLPGADSPILTRELLYTAVTRARAQVTLVGSEESVRRAIERPISRSSGLRDLLWTGG